MRALEFITGNVIYNPTHTYKFQLKTTLVKMSSPDQYCAILSVQNITCPVYDLDLNIQFEGSYQTADELGT